MIEAVHSVLSNSSFTKAVIEQQSVVRSFAANPDRVQEAPQAPYISPYVVMDVNFDKAVLQLRDSNTGDVVRQIPTESQLEAYKRAQDAAVQKRQAPAPQSAAPQTADAPQTSVVASSPSVVEPSTSQASYAPMAGNIAVSTEA